MWVELKLTLLFAFVFETQKFTTISVNVAISFQIFAFEPFKIMFVYGSEQFIKFCLYACTASSQHFLVEF